MVMKNISFDIATLILLCFLVVSIILRKMTSGISNRIFLTAALASMLSTCFDLFSAYADSLPDPDPAMVYIAHIGYLAIHNFQAPLQVLFIVSLTDTWHKLRKNIFMNVLLFVPYAVTFVLLATTPITGLIFTADPHYSHGSLFITVYVCFVLYIFFDLWYIIRYFKQLGIHKTLALLSISAFVLIAAVVHILFPTQQLECFAVAMSLFTISVTIQRPEDFIDSFTGLMKHSAYAGHSKRSYENGKHWNVVMLNIGNFISVQSMIGYELSRELLKIVADKIRLLNRRLGKKGAMYYLDLGRYRVVFSDQDRYTAEQFAQHITNELKLKIRCANFDVGLTPCVVLARCPEEIESFKSLMAFGSNFHETIPYSGKVMQAAEVYNPRDFAIRNDIDAIIDRALENESFRVYYQPIYSVSSGKFVSAEALLRLKDEEHGFISPEILIPAAEKNGAIIRIGDFVLEEVCRFIAGPKFKQLGLEYIEVNLSVAQCMHADMADKIINITKRFGISPSSINLEITETAASFAQNVMTENLNKLSRAGFTFSLDDFGTGYSNLKRVISIPLKIVKLDKSFVDEQNNPKMWIIMQNTVKMIKDMNMEIVVEGIETKEMVEAFSELECDFIQGYFFSKPICTEDFVKFISDSLTTT